jgi:hypothetical protein
MPARTLLSFLLLSLLYQNLNSLTPDERAKLEEQNNHLRALLQNALKLPFEANQISVRVPEKDGPMSLVSWIAGDRNGLVYLLQRDPKIDPVFVVDRNGKVVRSWGKGMYKTPHGIRVDPKGNVWTTDAASSMVYEFTPDGRKLLEIEIGGQPTPCGAFCSTTDIAFAPNGHLFITDGYRNARVLEYSADGKKIREWGSAGTGPGQFRLPHSIQIDENGIIYIADRENGRIQRFDLQGKYLGEWSQYGKTFGLALQKDTMWLSSIPRGSNNQSGWLIQVDRKTGNLLGYLDALGNHGMDVMPNGDLLSASPGQDEFPQLYRLKR